MFNAFKNRYTLWGLIVLTTVYTLIAIISNVKDSPVFSFYSPEKEKIGEKVERIRLCTFVPSGKLEKLLGVVVQRHNEIRILPLQHAYSMMHDSEAARFGTLENAIMN